MMFSEFETVVYGKWILTGEHAVLRGHPAIAFPLKSHQLSLKYQPAHALSLSFDGFKRSNPEEIFLQALNQGFNLLGLMDTPISGAFSLNTNIPFSGGMGASAALCTALARWFQAQGLIKPEEIFSFARDLEHIFHGKSSGLDIAGVAAEQGIFFQEGGSKCLEISWQPYLYLSTSGQHGFTFDCIQQVETLWNQNLEEAQLIDMRMHEAVLKAKKALESATPDSLSLLVKAIHESYQCFEAWNLLSSPLKEHISHLYKKGALAAKPTGSGRGGFVLSLWKDPQPADPDLLPVF